MRHLSLDIAKMFKINPTKLVKIALVIAKFEPKVTSNILIEIEANLKNPQLKKK
jgi:hypothetical protein